MNPIIFQQQYRIARDTPSDINEHIETLNGLANEVNHITEMGVRTGVSTRAFMNSNAILRCYDLFLDNQVIEFFKVAKSLGKDADYIQANVLEIDIEETDLLFIDTLHCYDQLIEELKRHAPKVRKYIAFHDTQTFGVKGEVLMGSQPSNGLLPAIIDYIIDNPGIWQFKLHRTNNNGLTVIERIRQPL